MWVLEADFRTSLVQCASRLLAKLAPKRCWLDGSRLWALPLPNSGRHQPCFGIHRPLVSDAADYRVTFESQSHLGMELSLALSVQSSRLTSANAMGSVRCGSPTSEPPSRLLANLEAIAAAISLTFFLCRREWQSFDNLRSYALRTLVDSPPEP